MKINDVVKKPFYILMTNHGVKGAAVEVNDADIQRGIREVRQLMRRDKISTAKLKKIHAELAAALTKMLPDIMRHGNAVSPTGEFYDQQKFDDDLVACAIYDFLANGKQIGITDNIGPGPGDKVHE